MLKECFGSLITVIIVFRNTDQCVNQTEKWIFHRNNTEYYVYIEYFLI